MNRIISCDSGLSGAISVFENDRLVETIKMPLTKIEIKPAIRILNLDPKGKKQYYKSGPKKNQAITKIKTAAKYKNILNIHEILKYFDGANIIVIEEQNPRPGGSAQSSFTTGINYGRLLASAELSRHAKTVVVSPNKWKTAMHITMNKDEKLALGGDKTLIKHTLKAKACALAEKITGNSYITKRGAMMHDEAESVLIGVWYNIHHKN